MHQFVDDRLEVLGPHRALFFGQNGLGQICDFAAQFLGLDLVDHARGSAVPKALRGGGFSAQACRSGPCRAGSAISGPSRSTCRWPRLSASCPAHPGACGGAVGSSVFPNDLNIELNSLHTRHGATSLGNCRSALPAPEFAMPFDRSDRAATSDRGLPKSTAATRRLGIVGDPVIETSYPAPWPLRGGARAASSAFFSRFTTSSIGKGCVVGKDEIHQTDARRARRARSCPSRYNSRSHSASTGSIQPTRARGRSTTTYSRTSSSGLRSGVATCVGLQGFQEGRTVAARPERQVPTAGAPAIARPSLTSGRKFSTASCNSPSCSSTSRKSPTVPNCKSRSTMTNAV